MNKPRILLHDIVESSYGVISSGIAISSGHHALAGLGMLLTAANIVSRRRATTLEIEIASMREVVVTLQQHYEDQIVLSEAQRSELDELAKQKASLNQKLLAEEELEGFQHVTNADFEALIDLQEQYPIALLESVYGNDLGNLLDTPGLRPTILKPGEDKIYLARDKINVFMKGKKGDVVLGHFDPRLLMVALHSYWQGKERKEREFEEMPTGKNTSLLVDAKGLPLTKTVDFSLGGNDVVKPVEIAPHPSQRIVTPYEPIGLDQTEIPSLSFLQLEDIDASREALPDTTTPSLDLNFDYVENLRRGISPVDIPLYPLSEVPSSRRDSIFTGEFFKEVSLAYAKGCLIIAGMLVVTMGVAALLGSYESYVLEKNLETARRNREIRQHNKEVLRQRERQREEQARLLLVEPDYFGRTFSIEEVDYRITEIRGDTYLDALNKIQNVGLRPDCLQPQVRVSERGQSIVTTFLPSLEDIIGWKVEFAEQTNPDGDISGLMNTEFGSGTTIIWPPPPSNNSFRQYNKFKITSIEKFALANSNEYPIYANIRSNELDVNNLKLGQGLTRSEALQHPFWLEVVGGDQDLLRRYVDLVYRKEPRGLKMRINLGNVVHHFKNTDQYRLNSLSLGPISQGGSMYTIDMGSKTVIMPIKRKKK